MDNSQRRRKEQDRDPIEERKREVQSLNQEQQDERIRSLPYVGIVQRERR